MRASTALTLSRGSPFHFVTLQAIDAYVHVFHRDNRLVHAWPTVHDPAQLALDPERRFTEMRLEIIGENWLRR